MNGGLLKNVQYVVANTKKTLVLDNILSKTMKVLGERKILKCPYYPYTFTDPACVRKHLWRNPPKINPPAHIYQTKTGLKYGKK